MKFVCNAGYFERSIAQNTNKRVWERKRFSTLVPFHVQPVFSFFFNVGNQYRAVTLSRKAFIFFIIYCFFFFLIYHTWHRYEVYRPQKTPFLRTDATATRFLTHSFSSSPFIHPSIYLSIFLTPTISFRIPRSESASLSHLHSPSSFRTWPKCSRTYYARIRRQKPNDKAFLR